MKQDHHNSKMLTVLLVFLLGFIAGCTSHKNKNFLISMFSTEKIHINPPVEKISADIRDKPILKGMKYIWEYQEDFAYRHKRLPCSISEMGDGTQIGRNGIVTRRHIWEARYDAREPKPDSETGSRYCYKTIQVTSAACTNTSAIVAIPVATTNAFFIAICGPVDLTDPLSFKRRFPVYKLGNDSCKKIQAILANPCITREELMAYVESSVNRMYRYDGFFALDMNLQK